MIPVSILVMMAAESDYDIIRNVATQKTDSGEILEEAWQNKGKAVKLMRAWQQLLKLSVK